MKIGAGHKPQGFDALGRYTGPRGGSMPMGGGKVRLFGAEGLAGEPGGEAPDEPGEGLEATAEVVAEALEQAEEQARQAAEEAARAAQEFAQDAAQASSKTLDGVLLADSGRVVSDAGGGAEKAPATITWKNDNGSPVPTHTGLESHTKETAENLRKDNPQMNSLNVNSGKRIGDAGPHGEGRAVDINRINGVKAGNLADPKTPEAVRAREAADRMVERARDDKNVTQVLGPTGCWRKDGAGEWKPITPNVTDPEQRAKNNTLIEGHRDHFHITVKRR